MKRAPLGMVMIEFTMAAVGLVAIALVTVRVGHWLNDAMVERNTSYQASRPAASDGPGLEPFGGPSEPLKLLGPPAALAPGAGTPGGGDSTVTPTCGSGWLGEATAKRWEAASLLMRGAAFSLDEQSQITYINAINWNMLTEANYLANYAIRVDDIRNDIMNRIYPRLLEINNGSLLNTQDRDIVQGVGSHDICAYYTSHPDVADPVSWSNPILGDFSLPGLTCSMPSPTPLGIHQIDERLTPLNQELNDPTAVGSVAWELSELWKRWGALTYEINWYPPGSFNPYTGTLDSDGSLYWQAAATYAGFIVASQECNVTSGGIVNGSGTISSCFTQTSHPEVNIHAPGTEVTASSGGNVFYHQTCDVATCGYDEYRVTIDHGAFGDGRLYSIYTHVQGIDPATTTVTIGQVIGTGGSTDLGYTRFVSSPMGFGQYVDPLNGSCSPGQPADVFETPVYPHACDTAHDLSHPVGESGPGDPGGQLQQLLQQVDVLKAEQAAVFERLMNVVYPLARYLTDERALLQNLENEVNSGWGLYPQTFNYLNEVDNIVSAWNPLWQQLHNERPADFPSDTLWDIDLSDLFQETIIGEPDGWDPTNANSPDTVVIEEIPGYLDTIIGRLLLLMRERLDHTDWSELPWIMGSEDYIGLMPSELVTRFSRFDVPWRSDDDHNPGGQREANERVMYLEGNPVIEHHLVNYNDEIRKLILDAEELERQARRECTSEPD